MAGIQINNLDIDIIRAWKDEDYLDSLSEEQVPSCLKTRQEWLNCWMRIWELW